MIASQMPAALVTGAGRGIGRAIAKALAATGVFVYINYRSDENAAAATRQTILDEGGRAECLGFDVTDQEAALSAVRNILSKHKRIDILVNNAGVRDDRLMAMMKKESWSRVVDTGLSGFFNVTKPVIKAMIKRRYGRIVNIVSAAGQMGNAGQINYSAAKAGLIGATKALSREVAGRQITVNAVSPGFIKTDMLEGMDDEKIVAAIPAGRLGTSEEVAHVVVFLCSENASYISGQVVGVNGGLV